MVYSTFDAYQPVHAYPYSNDTDEEYSMSHWQNNHFLGSRPTAEMYYNQGGPQPIYSHDHHQGHNGYSWESMVPVESTYASYRCPQQGFDHPYYSSPSTMCDSSSASSGTLSPLIGSRAASMLPSPDYNESGIAISGYSPHNCTSGEDTYSHASCITMQIVQKNADTMHEDSVDDFDAYTLAEPQELVFADSNHEEGMPSEADQDTITVARVEACYTPSSESETNPSSEADTESEYEPQPAPAARRQRASTQRSPTATRGRNRVTKPSSPRRSRKSPVKPSSPPTQDSTRPFLCPLAPYGCTAVFSAKNEWKRHATTQHFQLGFWRCDQCTHPPSRPNDFNRKDLYVQHVRRMHPPSVPAPVDSTSSNNKKGRSHSKVDAVEVALNKAAARCYQRMREAPESCCCVFCEEKFEGETALERRLEHVGKHMERQRKIGSDPVAPQHWREDKELEAWLLRHGLLARRRGKVEISK